MHYLLITDGRGEHVLFKGTRDALEQVAAKMRRDFPALRLRVTGDGGHVPVLTHRARAALLQKGRQHAKTPEPRFAADDLAAAKPARSLLQNLVIYGAAR
jgi:hypothetical protein